MDGIGGAELTSVSVYDLSYYLTDAVVATFGIDISRVSGGKGGGARIGGRCNATQQDNFNFDVAVTSGGLVVDECYFCNEGVRILSAALAIHSPPAASSYDERVTPTTQEFNLQGTIFFSPLSPSGWPGSTI